MDAEVLSAYRQNLTQRRNSLVGQVAEMEMYSRERDLEATQDPADMAANAYNKELLLSMSTNDRQLLNMIEEALARMEKDEYGFCVSCEEPIAPKRLAAIPWARLCLRCQELAERGELEVDDDEDEQDED
jgi:DnaK suppressor protein